MISRIINSCNWPMPDEIFIEEFGLDDSCALPSAITVATACAGASNLSTTASFTSGYTIDPGNATLLTAPAGWTLPHCFPDETRRARYDHLIPMSTLTLQTSLRRSQRHQSSREHIAGVGR